MIRKLNYIGAAGDNAFFVPASANVCCGTSRPLCLYESADAIEFPSILNITFIDEHDGNKVKLYTLNSNATSQDDLKQRLYKFFEDYGYVSLDERDQNELHYLYGAGISFSPDGKLQIVTDMKIQKINGLDITGRCELSGFKVCEYLVAYGDELAGDYGPAGSTANATVTVPAAGNAEALLALLLATNLNLTERVTVTEISTGYSIKVTHEGNDCSGVSVGGAEAKIGGSFVQGLVALEEPEVEQVYEDGQEPEEPEPVEP